LRPKLWNATRFAEMNGCATCRASIQIRQYDAQRWIAHETAKNRARCHPGDRSLRFNEAALAVRSFVKDVYCGLVSRARQAAADRTRRRAQGRERAMVAWARDEIFKLLASLHAVPHRGIMVGHRPGGREAAGASDPLAVAAASRPRRSRAEAEIGWVIHLVNAIRSVRAEMNIASAAQIPLVFVGALPRPGQGPGAGRIRPAAGTGFRHLLRRPGAGGAIQLVLRGDVAVLPLKASSTSPPNASGSRGDGQRPMPTSSGRRQARQRRLRQARARGGGRGRAREREEAQARKAKIAEALERLKGAS